MILNLLLGPLINLVKEALKDVPLQRALTLNLRDLPNHRNKLPIDLLLIHRIPLPQIHLGALKHHLDPPLALRVLPPIILVEDPPLLGRTHRQGGIHAPRTLVIEDIRADLPDLLRRAGKVEEVVLDLEVLAEGDEDGFGEGVGLDGLVPGWVGLWDVEHVHGEGDGEIEGVVCSFVDHDQ